MYEDEDEDEDEDDDDEDETGFDQQMEDAKKGTDDRAFVDEQAKEYDAMKKRKRDLLAALKQKRLTAQSKLSAKERKLHALEIALKRDQYVETRERIAEERSEVSEDAQTAREEKAEKEIEVVTKGNDRIEREGEYAALLTEVKELHASADEAARAISLLEHELFRS